MQISDLRPDDALWQFATERFSVEFHATDENMPPEDSFDDDRDVVFARSGDPAAWFCAWVLVRDLNDGGVLGYNTLGGCSYHSFKDFCEGRCGYRGTHKLTGRGYFGDMVREAIADARATMAKQGERASALRAVSA